MITSLAVINARLSFSRNISEIIDFWHLSMSGVMQCNVMHRGFLHSSSHLIYRLQHCCALIQVGRPTSCSLRWLRTMCAGCFSWCRLHMPWGAKKRSTETKTPEVSTNLRCAILLIHSCIQKLESTAVIPATTFAENFMEPIPDEVRWSVHVLRSLSNVHYRFRNCLITHRASFQQKQIML